MENHQERLERFNINQRSAMITISLCIFVDVLGYSMIVPLLPNIVRGIYGASEFIIGMAIASNAATALFFAPIWGKLSDRYGRKPILLVSQVGTLSSFLLLGFSSSLEVVFLSRIFDGVFGGQIPVIRAYIADITESKTRSTEMGKFTGIMAFGMIFGPVIGGFMGIIDLSIPPFIASFLSFLSIIFTIRFLVESMPKERRLENKKIKETNNKKNPGGKNKVLTKVVWLRLGQLFIVSLTIQMFNTSISEVIQTRYGLTLAHLGIFATIAGILMIIFGVRLTKPLVSKLGEKKVLVIAIISGAFVALMYPLMIEAWMLLLFVVPFVFSNVFSRTITTTTLSRTAEEHDQGIVNGWGMNMQSISQILAPVIAFWYLDIGILTIFTFTVDAYFLLGFTSAMVMLILLILVLIDIKYYSKDYTQPK
ncbi:MAG: MFS transporter [Promethearchaeota archaeon]